ncbi:MAG TPA: DUF2007 domain-containing protein [Phnomibacter sp.]|nr:DUF2007 domain-containing protein [Phnomibacter sp.]
MNWTLLFKTSLYTEAAIVKGKLEEHNIPVQVLNKQDSMYVLALPGMHEVYVPGQLKEFALRILNEVLKN